MFIFFSNLDLDLDGGISTFSIFDICVAFLCKIEMLYPFFDLTANCDKYHFNQLEPLSLQLPRPWWWSCREIDRPLNVTLTKMLVCEF